MKEGAREVKGQRGERGSRKGLIREREVNVKERATGF